MARHIVKIYGYGWVGKAMHTLFPDAHIIDPEQGYPHKGDYEPQAHVAFICVPTPLKDGKLDTSIVEEVVKNCKENLIIIRSTVMPGTCDRLEKLGKNIIFQPEYLGETVNHPMSDQKARPFIIIGGRPNIRKYTIELYQEAYNANISIRQMSCYEAEVVKLSENRAIAFKVMQCQELYDACEKAGIDYYTIRDAVYGDDPRFNLWWTFVFPDKRGFNNSKCLVKDVPAWCAWAESLGANADITKLLVEKSNAFNNNPS
jgi:UDPglucose 6-dehydrogenase